MVGPSIRFSRAVYNLFEPSISQEIIGKTGEL